MKNTWLEVWDGLQIQIQIKAVATFLMFSGARVIILFIIKRGDSCAHYMVTKVLPILQVHYLIELLKSLKNPEWYGFKHTT